MQVKHDSGIIEGNITDSAVATIRATPEMFSMLSKLYSDPIKAVVREIYANAIDSHVQAGKVDVSPDVQLPSKFDNTFFIRDYGTGLSDKAIKKLYLSYGYSSKNDDNEQIGGFGVGSKSPFAYKDSFTVESFYNGKHYTYMVYFNNKRIPALSLVSEVDTTEPNGLKVSLAADVSDVDKFYNAAKTLFNHATIKPNLIGSSITYEEPEALIDMTEYKILANEYGQSLIIMGGVPYNSNIKILGYPVWLRVKIGDVSVTPSREEIQMDNETTKFLNDKIKELEPHVITHVENTVANAPSYWDACVMYSKLKTFLAHAGQNVKPQYKGKDLKTRFRFEKDKVTLKYYNLDWRKKKIKEHVTSEIQADIYNQNPTDYMYFADTYNKSRLKYHLIQNSGTLYTISFSSDVAQLEFEEELGVNIANFKKLSSLPKPPPQANGNYNKGNLKLFSGDDDIYQSRSDWNKDYIDNGDDFYYVLINDRQLESMSKQHFAACVAYLKVFEPDAKIVGVPKTNRKKLIAEMEEDGKENIAVIYQKILDLINNTPNLSEEISAAHYLNDYSHYVDSAFVKFVAGLKSQNPIVKAFQAKTSKWINPTKTVLALKNHVISIKLDTTIIDTELNEFKQNIPMVYWLFLAYSKNQDEAIKTYIEQL